MLEHHLQKEILFKLVTSPSARFAELKPAGVDGNIFTYHLQQLIKQKYVVKEKNGTYGLTSLGKAVGINILLSPKELLEQAHSVFFIIVRDKDGRWLLRKRLAHPMYGKIGFVHGEPNAHESLSVSAKKALKERTGLTATFTPMGSGYIRIFNGEDLESFTHFTLLRAHDLTGTLVKIKGNGENIWLDKPDFKSEEMIPSMSDLGQVIEDGASKIFVELEYQVNK